MAQIGEKMKTARWRNARLVRATACVLPLLLGLQACSTLSSIGHAMNPGNWIASDNQDDPDLDRQVVVGAKSRPAAGLVGDTSNSPEYAAPVQRQVNDTKPLVKRPPVNVDAMQKAPAEAPVVAQSAPAQQTAAVAVAAPSGPPAYVPSGEPPARPDIPDQVAAAPKSAGTLLDHYHQRLRESAVQKVTPEQVSANMFDQTAVAAAPVHLAPPPMAANAKPAMGEPGSSFQVASLVFVPGSNVLGASDLEALKDVARLYKKTGGYVRVVGLGVAGDASDGPVMVVYAAAKGTVVSAQARADAAAHELVRLGVPGTRILVGSVALGAPPAADGAAARIYLDM